MNVGICGPIGSGKDLAAKILYQMYGGQTKPMAGYLKRACARTFDIPEHYFYFDKAKRINDVIVGPRAVETLCNWFLIPTVPTYPVHPELIGTPRRLLQFIGTDVLRKLDESCHVRMWNQQNPGDHIKYIPDIRFVNEVAACDTLIYMQRDTSEKHIGTHESESNYSQLREHADIFIKNNGDVAELIETIGKVAL